MDEIYGILDALEATIVDSKRVPLSRKVIVDEEKILNLIDKIRRVAKGQGNVVKRAIDVTKDTGEPDADNTFREPHSVIETDETLLRRARENADKITTGANEYADYVLANLQMLVTKMQTNLVKMEKTIVNGRNQIENVQNDDRQRTRETSHEIG